MKRVPSDVVKGVFHFLEKKSRFPANLPRISRVFDELSKREQYSVLLEEFVFDESRSYPYCETIIFALDRLQLSNLLACINPTLEEYEISEALAEDAEVESLFTVNEQELLKEIAVEFKEKIAVAS